MKGFGLFTSDLESRMTKENKSFTRPSKKTLQLAKRMENILINSETHLLATESLIDN